MSKKLKKSKNNFKYTVQHTLPKLGKVETSWDLERHYYTATDDIQIEKDIKKIEKEYRTFATKYRAKSFTKNASVLLSALRDLETLIAMPEGSKVGRYFSFRSTLNVKDTEAEKMLNLISERFSKASNEILFFEIELGKISVPAQKKLLTTKILFHYHYYLERVFQGAKHTLSEPEEKILNLTSNTSYGMWVDATEKMLGNRSVTFKKKTIPLTTALETLETYTSSDKPKLWLEILRVLTPLGEVTENELTAIATAKKVEDQLRGYHKPYSATIESYEDNERSTLRLINAVSTKGFELSREFYTAKAKYHGKRQIAYSQKYDSIGIEPNIPFSHAIEICRDVFYGLKSEYGEIFDHMLTNGQIDVYPRQGKRGGAFMSDSINVPTKVMLNHTDDFKSLETFAHEMGHAIHSNRSKGQSPLYQGHSIITAETVSTLFENLLFDAVFAQASEETKIVLLHDKLTRDIATIQRQISFFNFELEMHMTVREQGGVTHDELCTMMQKHLQSYLGDSVDVTALDGTAYVYVPHFRYGFYVYSYAFGILMSTLMAQNYSRDKNYVKKIDAFLCSGKSNTVENIFASIGISTNKQDTFLKALESQAVQVKLFKKLVSSRNG